jgi:GAF domain-containing protein
MTENNQAARSSLPRRVAGPPEYTAEDKAQTAKNLGIFLPVAIVLLGIQILLAFVQQGFQLTGFEVVVMALMLMLGGLWAMTRRGYVIAAATLLLLLTFVGMVFIASQANKIFDGAFTALVVVIVMAGVLLGWKVATVMMILSIAAAWWLASLSTGTEFILPPNTAPEYARDISIVFALTAVLIYLLIRNLRQALARSRDHEEVMREQNAELTAMRATLEQRVSERTAQLRAAADVGRVATSILDTQQLMSEVVNLITARFGLYYAAVFTLDRTGSYLILREATGEAGRILKDRGYRLRVGLDSMAGYAVLKREPRVALNAAQDTVRFANSLLPATQSEVALPLTVGDQVLGALDVQSTQQNAFDESTIATLQNVAAQIAVALQNAESYKQLQQALDYTIRQYELSRTIFAARTTPEAYESLGQAFAMLSGIDRIRLLRVADRDGLGQPTEYELATEWDVLGGVQFDTGQRYSAAEAPLARLVTEEEAIVIGDASDNRLSLATREQLAQAEAQAVLLVPLIIRGGYDGFIAATARQPYDFQDSEVRLVKSAAEQLGVVLSNLELTAEMQTTLERVALLNRRLSGEAWSSYLTGRDQWLVESGHADQEIVNAALQVPIVVRGQTIGLFNVADAGAGRQWQEEDLIMLQTIAGEVALAMENARLIEQTQRTAQREKTINEINARVRQSVDLDAILRTAVDELGQSLKAARVVARVGTAAATGTMTTGDGRGKTNA